MSSIITSLKLSFHKCTDTGLSFHKCTDTGLSFHKCTDTGLSFHKCTDTGLSFHKCTDTGLSFHKCTDTGLSFHKCTDTGLCSVYFIKQQCQQSSLPWMLLVQNKICMSFSRPTGGASTDLQVVLQQTYRWCFNRPTGGASKDLQLVLQQTYRWCFNRPTGGASTDLQVELQQTYKRWQHWIPSKLTVKFLREWTQELVISHTTVTLNEGQGHPNWYQNVELRVPIITINFWKTLVFQCLNTS